VRDIAFLHADVFSATCSSQRVLVGRRLALLGWPLEQRDMSDRSREKNSDFRTNLLFGFVERSGKTSEFRIKL
jgi:hypothetical protein